MFDFFFKKDWMGETRFDRLTWEFLEFTMASISWLLFGGFWVVLIMFLLGCLN